MTLFYCLMVLEAFTVPKFKVTLRPTASQSWCQAPSGAQDQIFVTDSCGFVDVGRPLWREDGSVSCRGYSQLYMSSICSHFASWVCTQFSLWPLFWLGPIKLGHDILKYRCDYFENVWRRLVFNGSLNGLPWYLYFKVKVWPMLRPTGNRPVSWCQAPSEAYDQIFFSVRQLQVCWCEAPSLTRGRVCRLQLLLVLASAVILGSESRGTHDHILKYQIRDFPNLKGHIPLFIFPRNRVAQLCPQALGSLFIVSYDSQGYGGGIWTRLRTGLLVLYQNYFTTGGLSPISSSWHTS
jgi:hypothetical protein